MNKNNLFSPQDDHELERKRPIPPPPEKLPKVSTIAVTDQMIYVQSPEKLAVQYS
jgi:hypothetical protein